MKSLVSTLLQRSTLMVTSFILAISSLSAAMPLFLSQTANAIGSTVDISTVSELCSAIENQANDQTWTIETGTYGLGQCNTIFTGGQTGWYFPITADNIVINGVGNPTIYGTGYTANGSWATQNFISIFGDNVSIDGITVMSKIDGNKAIEVMGDNSSITNVIVKPNTISMADYNSSPAIYREWYKNWAGSIYYNNASGTHTLNNVTIYNGGISNHDSNLNMNDVTLAYTFNSEFDYDYRFITTAGATGSGVPKVVFHLNNTPDNLDYSLDALQDGDYLSLDSNIDTSKQITISKNNITINGNNHTISPSFTKTDNSNNSALSIQANGARVNELTVDGQNGTNLHGINTYEAQDLQMWRVTVKNNDYSGLNVNRSWVQGVDLTTENNGWHGVDVDKPGAFFQSAGINHHNENPLVPAIYVDDRNVGQVNDTNNQYVYIDNYKVAGDRAYFLKSVIPAVPAGLKSQNNSNVDITNGITNVNFVKNSWTSVTGAVKYNYEFQKPNSLPTYTTTTTSTSIQGQFHNSSSPDGQYAFRVQSVAINGLVSEWSDWSNVSYDKTAPLVQITSPVNQVIKGNTVTITGSANDSLDFNYYYCYVTLPGSSEVGVRSADCNTTWHPVTNDVLGTVNVSGLTDGTYEAHLVAYDKAGNHSDLNYAVQFTLDNTNPTISASLSDTLINATDANPILTVNANDPGSGIAYTQYSIMDSTMTKILGWFTIPGNTTDTVDVSSLSDGDYTVRARAFDNAGNKKSGADVAFTINRTLPAAAITTSGTQSTATPTISGTVDANATSLVFKIDGATQPLTWNPGDTTWTSTPATALSDGIHNMSIVATDTAGNEGGQTGTITISVPAPIVTPLATTPAGGTGTPAPAPQATVTPGEVLGDQTTNNDAAKTGDSNANPSASILGDATSNPMNLFGLAWYWWLAILAAIIAAWWIIAAALRRRDNENA